MNEKIMYQNLYNKMIMILNNVNNSISLINRAIENSNGAIVINGVGYKRGDLNEIKKQLIILGDTLKNTHILEIKKQIAGLD